jgi:hypothetical protein
MAAWSFTDQVPIDRVRRLLALQTFDHIVDLLRHSVVTGFAAEPFRGLRLRGCERAVFQLTTQEEVYDLFFNSPVGYRGQYADSERAGEAANRAVIDVLQPSLLSVAARSAHSWKWVAESLRGTQAKIWIDEDEAAGQLGRGTPDIRFDTWQEHSDSGVGLLAPVGTRLEIKGAWVDEGGKERVDPLKVGRANEIHLTGFS